MPTSQDFLFIKNVFILWEIKNLKFTQFENRTLCQYTVQEVYLHHACINLQINLQIYAVQFKIVYNILLHMFY